MKNYTTEYDGMQSKAFRIKVPPQMSSEMLEVMETAVEASKMVMVIFSGSCIITSFVFASLLQYLWGMINTMQLMMATALFSVILPTNVQMFMFALLKLANFDIYNTEDFWNSLFHMKEQGAFNAIFEHAGY